MIERAHFRRCLAIFAAGAVLAAGLAPMAATAAPRPDDTADLLAGLSSDQRRALEAMSTLEVDPLNFEQETLASAEAVDVIVAFTQQPAKVDRLLAAADGVAVTEEAAKKRVADSHRRFKDDLAELFVDEAGASTPPAVTVEYTEAFNGAKVTVPGDQIEKLLESGRRAVGVARLGGDRAQQHAGDRPTTAVRPRRPSRPRRPRHPMCKATSPPESRSCTPRASPVRA